MKVTCRACGAAILEATSTRNGGLCMPCKGGTRASIEASRARATQERERNATDPFRIYWRQLVNRVHQTPSGFAGLSEQERQYFAVACLSGEVYNGGFDQFFSNSSGGLYEYAIRGLSSMGAAQSLELLLKAKQVLFDTADVPEDSAARWQLLESRKSDSQDSHLDQLDKMFWKDPDGLGALSRAFAKRNSLVITATGESPAGSRDE